MSFFPYNPIPDGGYFEIALPPNVQFYKDTYCEITTTKHYTKNSGVCDFDLDRKKIFIKDAFSA